MREWPVPKRWTSPAEAIASAQSRLARSISAACDSSRDKSSRAASTKRSVALSSAGDDAVLERARLGVLEDQLRPPVRQLLLLDHDVAVVRARLARDPGGRAAAPLDLDRHVVIKEIGRAHV